MLKKVFGRQIGLNINNNKRQASDAEEFFEIERHYDYHLNQKKDKIPPFILPPDFGMSE